MLSSFLVNFTVIIPLRLAAVDAFYESDSFRATNLILIFWHLSHGAMTVAKQRFYSGADYRPPKRNLLTL